MFNPFKEKPMKIDECFGDWKSLNPQPYQKMKVSPYTKVRMILMNGTEFESCWFMHQFMRHCDNADLRRELALIRRNEQQQQKRISALKPCDENILETTIAYEQLAVDLTAILAKRTKDANVKKALDFALLEDFDHLYRFSNLLKMDFDIDSSDLVGDYTEVTVGRPTISEHRYPYDDIKNFINSTTADPFTKLATHIITAAEQQTMNFYMNIGNTYPNPLGRKLYSEIAMIEEQHVSQYGSLIDPNCTWLENWLMHEYVECYLYYSCFEDESDPKIKKIWGEHLKQEITHLHKVAELVEQYENKTYQEVLKCEGDFPEPLKFGENIEYIRDIIKASITITAFREDYKNVIDLDDKYEFFTYQKIVNTDVNDVASHNVIEEYIKLFDKDYRVEQSPHPIEELQDRCKDNTKIGRVKKCDCGCVSMDTCVTIDGSCDKRHCSGNRKK